MRALGPIVAARYRPAQDGRHERLRGLHGGQLLSGQRLDDRTVAHTLDRVDR